MFFNLKNRRQQLEPEGARPRLLVIRVAARAATAAISLVGMSLFAAAIPRWEQTFVHHKGPTKGAWQDGLPIAPLLLSLIENSILCICMVRRQSIHTLLHTVPDFLIWGLLIPAITFATWGGSFQSWRLEPTRGVSFCSGMNAFSRECFPALYTIGALELAAVVFACIVWVFHMSFLICSAVEICLLRRASNALQQQKLETTS